MQKLLLGIACAALIAGCTTTSTKDNAAVEDRGTKAANANAGTQGSTGNNATGTMGGTQTGKLNPLKDPANILSKRSVYFDFDSSEIKDQYKPLIEAHGKYLGGTRAARMTIQGNCDERGSREYNLALGQRRADAVKKVMLLLGANDSQIETVSFGKEKPKNAGHDEAAWAENRRDDIVYAGD